MGLTECRALISASKTAMEWRKNTAGVDPESRGSKSIEALLELWEASARSGVLKIEEGVYWRRIEAMTLESWKGELRAKELEEMEWRISLAMREALSLSKPADWMESGRVRLEALEEVVKAAQNLEEAIADLEQGHPRLESLRAGMGKESKAERVIKARKTWEIWSQLWIEPCQEPSPEDWIPRGPTQKELWERQRQGGVMRPSRKEFLDGMAMSLLRASRDEETKARAAERLKGWQALQEKEALSEESLKSQARIKKEPERAPKRRL